LAAPARVVVFGVQVEVEAVGRAVIVFQGLGLGGGEREDSVFETRIFFEESAR